jgi:glutathione S-transferase
LAKKALYGTSESHKLGTFAMMEKWLTEHEFIAGESISIADLFGVCEMFYVLKMQI